MLKHAGASRISVTVAARQDWLEVEVVDDGVGGVGANAPLTALRDRIVSVGMLEHVGAPNFQTYFETIARLLDQHERGSLDHAQPLWALLMFDAFLRNAGLGTATARAAA